jgi:tRNA-binding EMAP/Myf-like protein
MGVDTHKVEIVPVEMEKHPDADSLSIVRVYNFTCVVRTEDWKGVTKAAYVQPDSVLPDKPEFRYMKETAKLRKEREDLRVAFELEHSSDLAWIAYQERIADLEKRIDANTKYLRVAVKKLRGVISMGMLLPCPEGAEIGDDVAELLGITHYEPPTMDEIEGGRKHAGDDVASPPAGVYAPMYDVESVYKYANLFESGELVYVSEKIDGCIPSQALINMADGSKQFYRNVNVGDLVLGLDKTGELVPSRVLRKFNNGSAEKWLKIQGKRTGFAGRGNHFWSVTCSPRHCFWNPEMQDYTRADALKIGDAVLYLRTERQLTPVQEQVILGKLLGDGSLCVHEQTATLHYCHSIKDQDYIYWTAQALGDLSSNTLQPRTSGYGAQTLERVSLGTAEIKRQFGSFIRAGKKIIPSWVANKLAPISLAFWYMDDGSLCDSKKQEVRASIAACAFDERDCGILIKGLKKLGITANQKLYKSYRYITFDSDNAERLFLLVAPYVPPCMQRKLPERYRGYGGWIPKAESWYKPILVTMRISSIKELLGKGRTVSSRKFDMETETGNYFVHNVLTHNSNARFVASVGNNESYVERSESGRVQTCTNVDMHAGSRKEWKKKEGGSNWWRVQDQNPWIPRWCFDNQEQVLYGENFGWVGELKYGSKQGQLWFRAFDILNGSEWMDAEPFRAALHSDVRVPDLGIMPFDFEKLQKLADGPSLIPGANHMREGIVIKPLKERRHYKLGRVMVKMVSNAYLEKKAR